MTATVVGPGGSVEIDPTPVPVVLAGFPNLSIGYAAGVDGTPVLPVGAIVTALAAKASGVGSVEINGGGAIPLDGDVIEMAFPYDIGGPLVAPVILFTDTDAYVITYLVMPP